MHHGTNSLSSFVNRATGALFFPEHLLNEDFDARNRYLGKEYVITSRS